MQTIPLVDVSAEYGPLIPKLEAAFREVLEDGRFIRGPHYWAFQEEAAAFLGVKRTIGVANGTDALVLALDAMGVGPGDEVICPAFTFYATAESVVRRGATPVFAEVDPVTLNLDVEDVAAKVTDRTKAIIPVDLFGQIAEIEEIRRLLPSMPIIEDAAQTIGARRKIAGEWTMAGQTATIGTFSFFPSKNLGGYGDGGMMVTQDDALATRLKRLRVHGGLTTYLHEEVGYNSRLDALQAAALVAKLPFLAAWSAKRRENAAYYDAAFADLADVTTPYIDPANESIFNQYTLRVARRDELKKHLGAKGIGHSVYYPLPLHLQPCFAYLGYAAGACPEAERAANEVVSLPIYPELTRAQLDEVVAAVRGFYGR